MGTRKLAVALVPLLALSPGCGGAPEEEARRTDTDMQEGAGDTAVQEGQAALPPSCRDIPQDLAPTETPVAISLENGEITVSDDMPNVSRQGGSLRWTSQELHFVIAPHADGNGVAPLGRALHAGRPGARPLNLTVQGQPPCGVYKYSVAVWDADGDSLAVLDPPYQIIP